MKSRTQASQRLTVAPQAERVVPQPRGVLRRRVLRALATLDEATRLLAGSGETAHRAVLGGGAADPVDARIVANRLELRVNHDHLKVLERRVLATNIQK